MTLLQQLDAERARQREAARQEALRRLRAVLRRLEVADSVYVFGSVIRPDHFGEFSDIDIALEAEPNGMSVYQLTARLAEELGRPVDVVVLPECRFRDRIVREGEKWTLAD